MDVLNIWGGQKMVIMFCTPYQGPQDPRMFLEALETDMVLLIANLVEGANLVSPVVMAKLIHKSGTVLIIYTKVSSMFDAPQTVLDAPGICEQEYRHEKVQVWNWLPRAGKTGKGGIQVKALGQVAGAKIKKNYVQRFRIARPRIPSNISLLLTADHPLHRIWSPRT